MKKYVLLCFQIINMGGEQQYCRNKLKAMHELGYQVNLVSCDNGTIVIEDLKKYKNNIVPEMRYPPFCFTRRKCERVITKLLKIIGDVSGDIVFESVNPATSEWGELLAKKVGGIHFTFLLDEAFTVSKNEIEYFKFKLDRKELCGMDNSTLKLLFNNINIIDNNNNYVFDATCTNVVDNVECKIDWLKNLDSSAIKIGTIGRLEKGYVIPNLKAIQAYAEKHPSTKYEVILIGGTDDKKKVKKIYNIFKKSNNVKIFITGYIYPIPSVLIQSISLFFSTAGSALISGVDFNIPTITVDTFTGKPIGILNYTTKELMYSDPNSMYTFQYFADLIFEESYCKRSKTLNMEPSKNSNSFADEMKKQILFCTQSKERRYFDTLILSPCSRKYKIYKIVGRIFGIRVLRFLHLRLFKWLKVF